MHESGRHVRRDGRDGTHRNKGAGRRGEADRVSENRALMSV